MSEIAVKTVGTHEHKSFFVRDALKFSSIGAVVSALLSEVDAKLQLILKKTAASEIKLYSGDGSDSTPDAGALAAGAYYLTSVLPTGGQSRYEWSKTDDSTTARYPDSSTILNLAGLIDALVEGLSVGDHIVIDQNTAKVVFDTADMVIVLSGEEIVTFDELGKTIWE